MRPKAGRQLGLALELAEAGRGSGSLKQAALAQVLGDIGRFSFAGGGLRLRSYQLEAARAILDSVLERRGLSIVVMFPRQSGKNELQAQIEAYLLALFARRAVEMVKVSPTWKPQSQNAMRRLERVLGANRLLGRRWRKEQGYMYRVGQARISFLSGAPTSSVVGATASLLLECDEAQDVSPMKWDKEILPMASSTNATRVYWGTAWTAETLLGRELRAARGAEQADGRRRVFSITADEVRQEVPAYGSFVDGEIAKLGRAHPFIRTQYFCEELESGGGMFPAARLALMQGDHPAELEPGSGPYAFLVDVGGEDEAAGQGGPIGGLTREHDATALTIVAIEAELALGQGARYRVVHRRSWQGAGQGELLGALAALVEAWQPAQVVIDATGVGAGLASLLGRAFPGRVKPFVFSQKSKSELGWRFLALVETGRYREYAPGAGGDLAARQAKFWRQAAGCELEVLPGPGKLARWGVPDGRRDPLEGNELHDDLLVSAALCACLEERSWGRGESAVIAGEDPLRGMAEAW